MLSNAYFLAKFRFDTAENEPAQKLQIDSPRGSNQRLGVELRDFWEQARAQREAARAREAEAVEREAAGAAAEAGRADAAARVARWSALLATGSPRRGPRTPLDRANFRGLVLGCIKTKFCNKICV